MLDSREPRACALSSRHVRKAADPGRRQPVHRRARLRGVELADGKSRQRSPRPGPRRLPRCGEKARSPTAIALCERAMAALEAPHRGHRRGHHAHDGQAPGQARGEVKTTAARARYMMSVAAASLADVVLDLDGLRAPHRSRAAGGGARPARLELPAAHGGELRRARRGRRQRRHRQTQPAVSALRRAFRTRFRRRGRPGEPRPGSPLRPRPERARSSATSAIDHVVFTGSDLRRTPDRWRPRRKHFLHPCLELGGNDPAYVAPDCDLANAVENVVDGAIYNAGQSCCAVERVYVHRSPCTAELRRARPRRSCAPTSWAIR